MHRRALAFALVAASVAALAAQSPKPTFEVASVKRTVPRPDFVASGARPGGVVVLFSATLVAIVRFAYDLPDYQVIGGPGWARTDRFDIEAKAGRDVSSEELRLMVQTLLADRF